MKSIAAAVFLVFFQANVYAVDSPDFSADMVSHSGTQTTNGKIYSSGSKIRSESAGAVMIMRLDRNVSWVIMPSQNIYMEQKIKQTMVPRTSQGMEGELERTSLGKDSIGGLSVEKFKVAYMEGINRVIIYQWVTDSGFPIKMEAVDGSWGVEYKNVSFSPQPASLFEVPDGCELLPMPN